MELKFDEKGLIPAIVQDHYTKQVLTLAYMNAETLALTIAEGRTVFWSRSRQEIWRKGETSGNGHNIEQIEAKCKGKTTIRFITMGDSQRWYDETEDFVKEVNKREMCIRDRCHAFNTTQTTISNKTNSAVPTNNNGFI